MENPKSATQAPGPELSVPAAESRPPAPAQSLFRGASWLAGSRVASQVYSWAGTVYVASLLLPADYGLYTLATAFTEFAFVLGNMGIGATLIQRQETDKKKIDNLFTATVILGLALALAAILLAYPGARYFKNPALVPLTQFTALIYIFNALSIVPYNFLNRDMRFRERGIIDMASIFIAITVQIAMAFMGCGVWALLAMPAVRFFVRMVLSFRYSGYRPNLFFDFGMLKEDMVFGAQITLNWFLSMLRERGVLIILGRYYSLKDMGLLTMAGTLAAIPNQKVVQLVQEVMLPVLAKRGDDHEGRIRGLATSFKTIILLVFPAYLCGYWYGEAVLRYIMGEKWLPMYPVFQILCVVQVWGMFAGFISTYNTAEGKPAKTTAYEAVLLALVPAATFLFRDLDLIRVTLIWGALIFLTYAVWLSILFRKERSFLPRIAGLKASVILVCALGFVLDRAMMRLFPASLDGLTGTALRVGAFSVYYLAYLRLFHWDFLLRLRRK